ncbi:MAG: DUF1566 domain-containing protein [Paludibacteraceae bacterium]|nr:DUF1566 domain-containing protein [Paludibacteraceae bacterium]MBN2787458.1 DUF1566 domain-containing protein [Paludibacteraceae bacterium]
MRKLITIVVAVLLTATAWAQSPEKMSYQAVIRNSSNTLVTSTAVGMQISILQGSASGTAVYVETQTPTTNVNGLVSIEIGTGTVVSGNFATIDWANGLYFIKTETDLAGGTNYTITGTSQLLSVPYALHAKTAGTLENPLWNSSIEGVYSNNLVGIGISNPDANLSIKDNTGVGLLKMVSNDNIYTIWQSDRFGVDDYLIGIDGGNNRFVIANITTSGFPFVIKDNLVGINQLTPQASLDVTGTFKLSDGSEGIGKVLTSDANGKASWEEMNSANNFYLGQDTLGGIVFYVYLDKNGNERGLILSKTETTTKWQNTAVTTNTIRSWDGAYNTNLMSDSPAKDWITTNFSSDWYLPSIDELFILFSNRFHVNKALNDAGATLLSNGSTSYWSSTELNVSNAFNFSFRYGSVNDNDKTNSCIVRPVRAF